ncbi:MAG: hypothetical protein ACKOPG_13075 [Novosphingobium sp.]
MALIAAGSPEGLPPDKDANGAPIVVVGKKLDKDQVKREVTDFVRQTGVTAQQESLARWVEGICPKVGGVDDKVAAIVVARIRSVARDAGVPVAAENCRTNIAVVFTEDGATMVREIADREPQRFSKMRPVMLKQLTRPDLPVRWWYGHETRARDGGRSSSIAPPWSTGDSSSESGQSGASGGGSILPMDGDSTSVNQYNSSLVSTQTIRVITSATVVIDVKQSDGFSLDAVASYAALVALAEIRIDAKPTNSILSLFEMESEVREFTKRDSAFLKAIYLLPLDRRIGQQRGKLVGQLVQAELAGN